MDLYKATLAVYGHELAAPEVSDDSEEDNEVNLYGVVHDDASDANDEEVAKGAKTRTQATTDSCTSPPTAAADVAHAVDVVDAPWPDFDNRIDSVAVLLARQAPNLTTLVSSDCGVDQGRRF